MVASTNRPCTPWRRTTIGVVRQRADMLARDASGASATTSGGASPTERASRRLSRGRAMPATSASSGVQLRQRDRIRASTTCTLPPMDAAATTRSAWSLDCRGTHRSVRATRPLTSGSASASRRLGDERAGSAATRRSSSIVVSPRRTRSSPDSHSVTHPAARAASAMLSVAHRRRHAARTPAMRRAPRRWRVGRDSPSRRTRDSPRPRSPAQRRRTQALRDDALHRGGDLVAGDADVDEASDGARRVVGVERGEHEVAGERRLDRDLRRLAVADLADEDDVRVLAHDGAQRRAEGEPGASRAPAPARCPAGGTRSGPRR